MNYDGQESEVIKRLNFLLEDFNKNGMNGVLKGLFPARKNKAVVDLLDEDYYAACLSCGAVILCGPRCCDNFVSQAMLDEKKEDTK